MCLVTLVNRTHTNYPPDMSDFEKLILPPCSSVGKVDCEDIIAILTSLLIICISSLQSLPSATVVGCSGTHLSWMLFCAVIHRVCNEKFNSTVFEALGPPFYSTLSTALQSMRIRTLICTPRYQPRHHEAHTVCPKLRRGPLALRRVPHELSKNIVCQILWIL